jgi:DNA-binding NtrC family response regulator
MDGFCKRVLVVDDDHHARFLLEALLDHAGYTVVPACDGRAALTELHKRHFDAVITDYRMPFLNGIELLRQIHIHYPQIPVILASGSLPVLDEPFLSDCRPFGWLRKPYDNRLLLELVRSAVDRERVVSAAKVRYQR